VDAHATGAHTFHWACFSALVPHLPRIHVLFPHGQEHEWDLDKLENENNWHEPDDVSIASAWQLELGDSDS